MTEHIEIILTIILSFLGIATYITILTIIIIDMSNKDPFTTNWEYFKKCLKNNK